MYRSKVKTIRLDMDKAADLERYSAVVQDPLCAIIGEHLEKIEDKEFEDGKMVGLHQRMVKIVTYEEKSLF